MRPALLSLAVCLAMLVVACTGFPELDARANRAAQDAPFPRLLPLDALMAGAAAGPGQPAAAGLEARAEALRRNAAALRGPVLDRRTRARLQAALARHSG